jgi:hypothetical protein
MVLVPSGLEVTQAKRGGSSCAVLLFMLHPLTNKIRAGNNTEIATFAAYKIQERDSIQLLKMSQVEQRP